jgi:predicted phage baseplate assembly protein
MPFLLPNLDDRAWAELVDEGRALVPVYAPEWTDQNVHDPGITFVELFAWLAEMDVYRVNRITERHRQKFLALVGIWPEPPTPARTVISFVLKKGHDRVVLPATAEVEGNDPFGQSARFRILEDLTVVAAELSAVQLRDSDGFHDLTRRWKQGEPFNLLGENPQPGIELYLGLSAALPPQVPVSFFFTFVGLQSGDKERWRQIQESVRQNAPPGASNSPVPYEAGEWAGVTPAESGVLSHHSVRTGWEYQSSKDDWQPLAIADEVKDDTRAFTLSGRVLISLPGRMCASRLGHVAAELFYLRCRFTDGAYDEAPTLANLTIHGVAAEQAVPPDHLPDQLGVGAGTPRQQFSLSLKPIVQSSFRLYTVEDGQLREWKRQRDFDASAPDDCHFLLDPGLGQVTFGDGQKGRVVPVDARVEASYLTTRAEQGNVAAGTIAQGLWLDAKSVSANNPLPAVGGAAAETLAHAEGRAAELMDRPTRAVTLADYEWFAKTTPGTRVARVAAMANLHPAFPGLKAPGLISVLVVPFLPADRPVPSAGLLRMIAAYLNRRRIIGTRVEVFGPTYFEVTVHAKVQGLPGRNAAALGQRITAALNLFFDPLRGGPDGNGWPFGRDVYRSEVSQIISETDGVDYVLALELISGGGKPQCGNIFVGPTGLVAANSHQIEVM